MKKLERKTLKNLFGGKIAPPMNCHPAGTACTATSTYGNLEAGYCIVNANNSCFCRIGTDNGYQDHSGCNKLYN